MHHSTTLARLSTEPERASRCPLARGPGHAGLRAHWRVRVARAPGHSVLPQLGPSLHCPSYRRILHSLHGVASQLEWGKDKVLQLDTHPTLKGLLSEKP